MGMGYSENFIYEMKNTITTLEKYNPVITLTDSCDILCKFCPNNIDGVCNTDCKVKSIDKNCLIEYNLNFGNTINWRDLKQLSLENIILKNKLCDVCKDCNWNCSEKYNIDNTFIKAL